MDKYQQLIKSLYTNDDKKWYRLPENLYVNSRSTANSGSEVIEIYYTTNTNQAIDDIPRNQEIKIVMVGRYLWKYYYEEEQYELKDGYFISLATLKSPHEMFDPSDVISIDDTQIDPIYLGAPVTFISIELLFKRVKEVSFDVNSFLDGFF